MKRSRDYQEMPMSDPRRKSDELVHWEAARAAYVMGEYHREQGKRMQRYWVKRLQADYEDGFKGVSRPDLDSFVAA